MLSDKIAPAAVRGLKQAQARGRRERGSTGKLCLAATSTSKAVKRGADGVVDWEAFVARQMLTFLA